MVIQHLLTAQLEHIIQTIRVEHYRCIFNNNNNVGTSYASQFSTLDTAGGTITISQGSSIAIYSGTSTDYQSSGTFINLNVTRSAQMIQSASTPFVSGTTINVVVS